jgi:hypothetical protein
LVNVLAGSGARLCCCQGSGKVENECCELR